MKTSRCSSEQPPTERYWRSASSRSTGTIQSSYTPCRYDLSSTGSLDEEVITMGHTDEEIEAAASRFEQLADEFDPETAEVERTEDLRAIAAVSEAVRADEARLREAVEVARAHDRSWNQIAVALGVSRQAARQRFTDKTHA